MSYIPEEILRNIDEVAHLVRQKGPAFLDHLIMTNQNVPNMNFLFPESPYYPILMDKLNNINQSNIHSGYPSHSLPNPEQKRPGSRWGINPAGQYQDQMNYPQHNQQYNNYQGYNQQVQGYNNPGQQPYYNVSPTNYSQGQGQVQGQGQQNYPNYQQQQNNPYMMYGNNNNNTQSNIPTYLNPLPPQGKPTNERKSSYDKREYNSGSMETENPQRKSSRQYTNPEEIPVGMMAEMIKHQSKRLKDRNASHKPYTPLDPEMTPQVIPPVVKVPDSVKTKIDLFYKFIADERELDKIAKSKKGTDVDLEIYKSKAQERKKDGDNKKNMGTAEYQQELINSEMGVRSDGRSITGLPSGEERRGLGGQSSDIYSQFRKQRSHTYHVSAEERAVNRDMPDLCYVCRMPGHLARECKFGLT